MGNQFSGRQSSLQSQSHSSLENSFCRSNSGELKARVLERLRGFVDGYDGGREC